MRILILLVLVAGAKAQDYNKRSEVSGQVGIGFVGGDEGSLGNGVAGGGSLTRRFRNGLALEFDVNAFRHSRTIGGFPFEGNGQFYTGNVLWHMRRGRVQPYLVAGAGGMRYAVRVGAGRTEVRGSTSGFAITPGFGVKAFLNENWFLRPEARVYIGAGDTRGGIEPPIAQFRISFGIGYQW